jgi:hypothetical protein
MTPSDPAGYDDTARTKEEEGGATRSPHPSMVCAPGRYRTPISVLRQGPPPSSQEHQHSCEPGRVSCCCLPAFACTYHVLCIRRQVAAFEKVGIKNQLRVSSGAGHVVEREAANQW